MTCTDDHVARNPGNCSNIETDKALKPVHVILEDAVNNFCTLDRDAHAVKTRINIQVKSRFIRINDFSLLLSS